MKIPKNDVKLAPDAAIDLHLHTTFSDGRWTPEELLGYLAAEQFGLAAVTDHDRPDTAAQLQQLAQDFDLPLLLGVEMTTVWQDESTDHRRDELSGLLEMTDLLCYGFDPGRHALINLAKDLWHRQCENTRQVFEILLGQGYQFPQASDALTAILEKPNPEQPHALAALLRQHGYGIGEPSSGRIILEAGCTFAMNDLAAVVKAAHQDGGVCLLAHPGHKEGGFVTYDLQMLDKLRHEIPIDGLEVFHPKHTPDQITMYLEYARLHGLLISAGSDSHSLEKPPIKYKAELCRDLLARVGIQVA
jgi:histidinol phosphatase-like PHP family hydrolase